ncbi:hypothetical protein N7448_010705 [Penicillium atrosanguineum]|uniref:CFEM domain-containing protein n=1 Tax=Penicillium atrosanguineum TaxID=1132637 RepID=A0A9W9TZX8_9EURO|nr:uncharacterized protein N7443_007927 [Penicillium atrosanguineum]KAJ5118996.1 hypothetical protein N7526_010633 [Penicillium atrosanguineum]KAJ5120036.1 hypothetical protein N7448_010705 [Penicillium atrosanguineum]KAJ5297034.1 hypothetical protein N7443_007927 [Penicillium atrosanguineum]KAJ5299793.1 hypothetical protein N7476_011350 [Penicillium atrosanguineum]
MRFLKAVALGVAIFTGNAIAGMTQLEAVLPACALKCMTSSAAVSSCAITDQTCLCTDATYTATLEECVVTSCTIRQSLSTLPRLSLLGSLADAKATKNVTITACGAPIRDRTHVVSYAGVAGGIIALLAFILRMVARFRSCGGVFGLDDWTMLFTMCLLVPLSALSVVLANAGLGRDMWTLPFENITRILYIYFWDELLYLSILPMTKISICCFYLRIFPDRQFRAITCMVIGLNVSYLIAFILISVFQCRPLDGAWLHWDGEGNYKCNHINAQGWSAAIINMVLDIIVMALPLRQLYHLNLSVRKKVYVMCMFGLGIFVTLVSILRLNSLIHFASTSNLTWDYVTIGYWSTIECDVGVICACLPAIRSLLRLILPGFFGDTENVKSNVMNSHSHSHSRGTGSRFEGNIYVQSKNDERNFYPLGDMDTSSEAQLNHHQT